MGHDATTTGEAISWSPRAGAHLEASRKAAGLRRTTLAARLGVSEETIRLWEKGAVQPSPDRLARLIAVMSLQAVDWQTTAEPGPERSELPPLARRLRRERDQRGATQAEAARFLDVAQATYAGWETGRATPGTAALDRLSAFLGMTEPEVRALCESPFVVDTSGWPPLGQLLGARRQALRLTRQALAERLDVAVRTVMAWELGYRAPAAAHLPSIAAALDVPPASLAAALPPRWTGSTLGELITGRLRELGLRSADLARLVGTTEATVSRWVNGRSRPAADNLRRLAEALQMPYAQVIDAAGAAI